MSKKEEKKQDEEAKIEVESKTESNTETKSDIPVSKMKKGDSKIDEGGSSTKEKRKKLKMSDFVKMAKANMDMMKESKK